MKNKIPTLEIACISVIAALAACLIFFRLGANTLHAFDEAIYAQIAREMLTGRDWITPHWDFSAWLEKPPLLMWLTAALFSIFKVSEFWARAVSAIAGVLLALVTYLIGKKAYNRWVGCLAAIGLLTNIEYLTRARNGTTDILLTLFIYLATLTYLSARNDKRAWYGIGVFFALAFMTKSWAAWVIPSVLLISLGVDQKVKETLRSRHFWGSVVLAMILISPWHLVMVWLHGKLFIDSYVVMNLVQRTTSAMDHNSGPILYYYDILKDRFSEWFPLIPLALASCIYGFFREERERRAAMLFILISMVFGLYSLLIQTKLWWYITPVYPAIYLLIGVMIYKAFVWEPVALWGAVLALGLALLKATRAEILYFVLSPALILLIAAGSLVSLGKRRASALLEKMPGRQSTDWPAPNLTRGRATLRWLARAGVVVMTIFMIGASMKRALSLYELQPSPLAQISQVAGATRPNEPVMFLISPTSSDFPILLFYSNRPMSRAYDLAAVNYYYQESGVREIILDRSGMQALGGEYEFQIIDEEPPFVYASMNKRPTP